MEHNGGVTVVCVHSLAQARAALGCGRAVVLISAPGAAAFGGCGWWRALVELAAGEAGCADLLDCGGGAGLAMAALRMGQRGLVLDAGAPGFARVVQAAEAMGARVLGARPPSLDMALPGALRRLATWDD